MTADFYAHRFYDDPKAAEQVEDDEFDLQAELEKLERGEGSPDDWEPV